MADSLKTDSVANLESITEPADTDLFPIAASNGSTMKKLKWSDFFSAIKNKIINAVISDLQTSDKTVLGAINELNSNIGDIIKIHTEKIENISVPATGSTTVTFTGFTPKSGYYRVVLDHNFYNSSSGGTNYSGMFIYNTTGTSDGIIAFIHNVWGTQGKVDLSLTVAYIKEGYFY